MSENTDIDLNLECCDCGTTFTYTIGEQRFMAAQGWASTPPKRCKPCRRFRKAEKDGLRASGAAAPQAGQKC